MGGEGFRVEVLQCAILYSTYGLCKTAKKWGDNAASASA
jgi:hypothetical protein